MFDKLKHKLLSYILKLTLPVILAMLAMLFSMYVHYISKDFDSKSEVFHSQISNTAAAKIAQIENTFDVIIKRNRLYEIPSDSFETRTRYNCIYSIGTYCVEASSAFLNYNNAASLYATTELKGLFPDFIEKYNIDERTRKKNSCWTYVDGCGWLCTKAIYPPGSSEKTGYITALINFNASNLFTEINSSFCSGYEYYLFYDGYLGKVYTKEKPEPSNALKKRLTETAVSGKARRYRNVRIYSDDIPGGFTFLTTVRYKYFTDIATHLGSKLVIFFILISALCIFTAIAFTKHIVSDISALRKNIDGYMEELDSRS